MTGATTRRAIHVLVLVILLAAGTAGGPSAAGADTSPPASGSASTCPASNPPNELTLVSGTPQTAQLDAAFASALQVALANTNGCPVTTAAGVPITFSAPAGGASGTFSASGSNSLTVGSDATGSASAGAFSANGTVGSYTIEASSGYGAVTFSLSNTATGIPARIRVLAPATQSARVATRYRAPLEVRVLDANGSPVEGVSVTFALGAAAGGSGGGDSSPSAGAGAAFPDGTAQAVARTNASGVARSPRFTADTVAGRFTATATIAASGTGTSSGASPDAATFSLDNLAGRSIAVTPLGRVRRTARVGTRYGAPLRVEVRGPDGKPLQGATVTFTLGAGAGGSTASATGGSGAGASFGGGASQATATTTASGVATSPRLAANTTAGSVAATASVASSTRTAAFLLRNVAGSPRTVAPGAAASESTTAGIRFPIPLAVTVSDAAGNPVAGVVVTFAAPTGGPSGRFGGARTVRVRTNAAGIAVAPAFTADGDAGGYVVEATVGHAIPAAFALVNLPPGAQQ